MPRTYRNVALIMIIFVATLSAQSRQGIVRITPFTGSDIPASELATLERLVASHVAELRLFRVIDDTGREMALGETETALSLGYQPNTSMPLAADFILSGHLGRIGDLYVFTLENTRVSSGEKISVSETSTSLNDTVLHARSLTRNLFGKPDDQPSSQPGAQIPETYASKPGLPSSLPATASEPAAVLRTGQAEQAGTSIDPAPASAKPDDGAFVKAPTLSQVAGTWRGDRGLETVRLFPNGSGMAVLSGGGTMRLRVLVDGDSVVIAQDQANDAAMYRSANITFDIARKIASQARPMKWIFNLWSDGQKLEGMKESILVSGTSTAITVNNDYVREASWTRISR
ncbi:MAG: hypothetical protein RBT68_10725 [Spirochaetia bacterium]|nr:hypothetical protein [Spirochaetia bacterium]